MVYRRGWVETARPDQGLVSEDPRPCILTPHPGEMAVLTDLSKELIQESRLEIAASTPTLGTCGCAQGRIHCHRRTGWTVDCHPVASPALARAGTGDVLAGLIVGLRAQGLDAYEAAVAGAWIHAQAGLYAADDLGTLCRCWRVMC
jgi:ADP-dependent NAD(P)H-hydrate dehydratase / NAD(P)H-hydrate epimerase